MFSVNEKREIAKKIEELLLSFDHPEMPDEKPVFKIHIEGKESWSWADIEPNWKFDDAKPDVNPWNQSARNILALKEMFETPNKKEYCTQNDHDCSTCSLVNYGRDCHNNPVN